MNFNEYQKLAMKTAIYPEHGQGQMIGVLYCALGLTSEAGEVSGKIKKILRDDGGQITSARHADIIYELGDTLWYLAVLAKELGISLEEVAVLNAEKLQKRVEEDKISGSGDDR